MKHLSHGFHVGENSISFSKILKWRHFRSFDIFDLCDYLIFNGFDIRKVDVMFFKVYLLSDLEVNHLYKRIVDFHS